jgi:hypothetical protein
LLVGDDGLLIFFSFVGQFRPQGLSTDVTETFDESVGGIPPTGVVVAVDTVVRPLSA